MSSYNFFSIRNPVPSPPIISAACIILCCFVWLSPPSCANAKNHPYEIHVHSGLFEESIEYLKNKNFWDTKSHDKAIDVPRIIVVATSKNWQKESKDLPVEVKKELFYRFILPMLLFANELILDDRQDLEAISKSLSTGKEMSAEEHPLFNPSQTNMVYRTKRILKSRLPDCWNGWILFHLHLLWGKPLMKAATVHPGLQLKVMPCLVSGPIVAKV